MMDAFDAEHAFYYTSDSSRLAKLLDRWFIFEKTMDVPGPIYELGVFKGLGLIQWATFRKLVAKTFEIVGFDVFGTFPAGDDKVDDLKYINNFVTAAGNQSISIEELRKILNRKGMNHNIKLIKGDAVTTIKEYCDFNQSKPRLINLDFDLYYPTIMGLKFLWPRLQKGGILLIDDFDESAGVRQAISEYFELGSPFRTPYRKLAYFVK